MDHTGHDVAAPTPTTEELAVAARKKVERLAITVMAADKIDACMGESLDEFLKLTPGQQEDYIDKSQVGKPANPLLRRVVRDFLLHPAGAGIAAAASERLVQSYRDLLRRCFIGAVSDAAPSSQTISPMTAEQPAPVASVFPGGVSGGVSGAGDFSHPAPASVRSDDEFDDVIKGWGNP